jgi:hypothetical protein
LSRREKGYGVSWQSLDHVIDIIPAIWQGRQLCSDNRHARTIGLLYLNPKVLKVGRARRFHEAREVRLAHFGFAAGHHERRSIEEA